MKKTKTEYVISDTQHKLFWERNCYVGFSKEGNVFDVYFTSNLLDATVYSNKKYAKTILNSVKKVNIYELMIDEISIDLSRMDFSSLQVLPVKSTRSINIK